MCDLLLFLYKQYVRRQMLGGNYSEGLFMTPALNTIHIPYKGVMLKCTREGEKTSLTTALLLE